MVRATACALRPAQLTIASNSNSPPSLPPKLTDHWPPVREAPVTGVLKAMAPPASSRSPRIASI